MKPQNFKLSPNITFYEYMEGKMPPLAIQWNWEYFDSLNGTEKEEFINNAKKIALEVQKERDFINKNYRHKNSGKEFQLIISCGFRCVKWELYKKRSGKGQHPIAAIDFVVSNCPIELSAEMHQVIHKTNFRTWYGGFAIKYPTYFKGKMNSSGFIHKDCRTPNREEKQRGYGTRWTY
jgi:hypothetical protein